MNKEEILKKVWPQWEIVRELGEGAFGSVYEVQRKDIGGTFKAALKFMSIPKTQKEISDAITEGMDEATATTYFRSIMEDLVKEFATMEILKGNTNIVSYEDHVVVEHDNEIGWDILIRMELLTPFKDYLQSHAMDEAEIIRLGKDICSALIICEKRNIVHRDIKMENVFVSEYGDFKLGDFGVARTVEKTTSGMSIKGTISYMAPEVYKGLKYNASVDLYSLGIMLYRLANNNRSPFLPPAPAPISYTDKENAEVRRLAGEEFPEAKQASPGLMAIIRKATAFNADERYSSAAKLKEDLEKLSEGKEPLALIEWQEKKAKSADYDALENEETVASVATLGVAGAKSVPAADTPVNTAAQTADAAEPSVVQSAGVAESSVVQSAGVAEPSLNIAEKSFNTVEKSLNDVQPGQPMNGMPMGQPGQPMNGMPMSQPGQPVNGMPMGQPGQPVNGMSMGQPGQPMSGMPMGQPGQPMNGMPMSQPGQPMNGMSMGQPGQPMNGQPMSQPGQPMNGQPMSQPGQPINGQPMNRMPAGQQYSSTAQAAPAEGPKKKSKLGLILGLAIGIPVVVIGIIIAVVVNNSSNSQRTVVVNDRDSGSNHNDPKPPVDPDPDPVDPDPVDPDPVDPDPVDPDPVDPDPIDPDPVDPGVEEAKYSASLIFTSEYYEIKEAYSDVIMGYTSDGSYEEIEVYPYEAAIEGDGWYSVSVYGLGLQATSFFTLQVQTDIPVTDNLEFNIEYILINGDEVDYQEAWFYTDEETLTIRLEDYWDYITGDGAYDYFELTYPNLATNGDQIDSIYICFSVENVE